MIGSHVIERLMEENAALLEGRGEQTKALECSVFLVGVSLPVRGSLAFTPEGALKLLTKANDPKGNEFLVEMFFETSSVTAIAVERKVDVRPSILVRS